MTTTINGAAPTNAQAASVASAFKLARHFGDFASAAALQAAFPAAANNGGMATVGGELVQAINGVWRALGVFEVATWGQLPAAASVVPGRTYTVLADGSQWRSDGAWWRPVNGRVLIAQRCGSNGAPIATLTGVTTGLFTLPLVPIIPAGMIAPHSTVRIDARLRRLTATATASAQVRFGTAGDVADSLCGAVFMAATANVDANPIGTAIFGTSTTSFFSGMTSSLNAASTAASADRTTQISAAAPMYVSIGMGGANAADQFALLSYSVSLES